MRSAAILLFSIYAGCQARPEQSGASTQSDAPVRRQTQALAHHNDKEPQPAQREDKSTKVTRSSAERKSSFGCKLPSQVNFCHRNPEPSPSCDQACWTARCGIKEREAREALERCYGPSPCKTVTRLFPRVGNKRWDSAQRCVLRHLRDGIPGRYELNYFQWNQFYEVDLYITPSKKVVVLQRDTLLLIPPIEDKSPQFSRPELCELPEPSFFSECLKTPRDTCFSQEVEEEEEEKEENFAFHDWFGHCELLRNIECPS